MKATSASAKKAVKKKAAEMLVGGSRRIEYVPIEDLVSAARNPKRHADVDIDKSVGRFGFTEPILMDERTGRLVAGHGRVAALFRLRDRGDEPPEGVVLKSGAWRVPVVRGWASRSDTEAEAYLLASNQLTIAGGWDDDALSKILQDLDVAQALEGVGFSDEELARLLASGAPPPEPVPEDEDPAGIDDVPEKPTGKDVYVKPGDVYQLGRHTLTCGDSREVLARLGGGAVHAVVTDPPYELGFMGKSWDASGVAYDGKLWAPVLAALRPGGHLVAFGGTRTYHRMTVAIEDVGFEIRDCVMWLYGTGFPKSHDVGKAIDEAAGAKRKVVGKGEKPRPTFHTGDIGGDAEANSYDLTAPATEAAKQWDGWGTALKPAVEPAVLARKPLIGTVAENVQAHGTGALNIDGSRVGTEPMDKTASTGELISQNGSMSGGNYARVGVGRWPSNVIMDPEAAEVLDAQSGVLKSHGGGHRTSKGGAGYEGGWKDQPDIAIPKGDSGGASRFFYVAKPSRSERDEGMDGDDGHVTNESAPPGTKGANSPRAGAGRTGAVKNFHPTVKPVALMKHLVRLVTPPGGTVLEPFSGSGTTLLACERTGVACFAIEQEPAYVQIAISRWEGLTGRKAVLQNGPAEGT